MKQENLVDERRQNRRVIRGKISFSPQLDLSQNVNSHHFIENLSCKRSIFKSSKIGKIKNFPRTNKLLARSESLEKLTKKLNIKKKKISSFVIYTQYIDYEWKKQKKSYHTNLLLSAILFVRERLTLQKTIEIKTRF